MRDLQKIEATVFVYRHRHTGNISAHYMDTALNLKESQEWEHVATLNPRAWIEFNYSVAEQRDELLAAVQNLIKVKGRYNTEIAFKKLEQALSKTQAQSLQSVINETIEECAKVCDEHGAIFVAKSIRALKVSI